MGFQFVHIETYGRKATPPRISKKTGKPIKRRKGAGTVASVLAEASRHAAASTHVADPKPPELVHGVSVQEAWDMHDRMVMDGKATMANGKQRAIRVDQQTLMTAVASYPVPWSEVRGDADAEGKLAEWEARNVEWFRQQFGDSLVSVVRHVDEKHPHLHVIALPQDMQARKLHPGFQAKEAAKAEAKAAGHDGETANKLGDRAYTAACRAMQDSYWSHVGIPCGLTRIGPARRSLTRGDWQREQAAAQHTARVLREAEEASARVVEARAGVAALAERGHAWKAYAQKAQAAARLAEEAEKAARAKAAEAIRKARQEAAQVVTQAESKAAKMAEVGSKIGAVWSGLKGVEKRLKRSAEAKVAKAKEGAKSDVAKATKAIKQEMESRYGGELAQLRERAAELEKKALEARQAAETERARRIVAERQAQQAVQHQHALADRLNALETKPKTGWTR